MYYWCQFNRGNEYTAGYIPERGAILGAKVELVEYGKEPWDVISVETEHPVTREYVTAHEKRYKAFSHSIK